MSLLLPRVDSSSGPQWQQFSRRSRRQIVALIDDLLSKFMNINEACVEEHAAFLLHSE